MEEEDRLDEDEDEDEEKAQLDEEEARLDEDDSKQFVLSPRGSAGAFSGPQWTQSSIGRRCLCLVHSTKEKGQ